MKLICFRIACSKPDWRIVLKFFREHRLLCTERIALMNSAARVCLTIHLFFAVQFSTFKIAMNDFRKYLHGYKLSLNSPDEIPRFSNNFIFVPGGEVVYVSIEPKIMTTSPGLRSYAPHERGCFFKSERHLRFFKHYSQQNCKLECFANFTRNTMDCVKYWMPSEKNFYFIYIFPTIIIFPPKFILVRRQHHKSMYDRAGTRV